QQQRIGQHSLDGDPPQLLDAAARVAVTAPPRLVGHLVDSGIWQSVRQGAEPSLAVSQRPLGAPALTDASARRQARNRSAYHERDEQQERLVEIRASKQSVTKQGPPHGEAGEN